MARPSRRVLIVLTAEQWDALLAQGRAEERDPFQQARWLVIRGLGLAPSPEAASEDAETAEVA